MKTVASVAASALLLAPAGCSSPYLTGQSTGVRVIDIAGPGRVLGDVQGFAFDMYLPDNRGASTCFSACAAA